MFVEMILFAEINLIDVRPEHLTEKNGCVVIVPMNEISVCDVIVGCVGAVDRSMYAVMEASWLF